MRPFHPNHIELKVNIALLTQVVPYPPDSGPKVKTWHVLRYLAEHGHQVTLVSFVRDHEQESIKHLQNYCKAVYPVPLYRSRLTDIGAYLASLCTGLPFLITRDDHLAMRQVVNQIASLPFDIVHADQLTMAQYALHFRRLHSGSQSPAIVFDAHNAVYEIIERTEQTAMPFLRPVLGIEARRLKHYEGNLIEQFDHTLTVSEIDKNALLNAFPRNARDCGLKAKISVIPIAVNCTNLQRVKSPEKSENVMTMGTLFYPPNADGVRWFMHQVFPLVQHQIPTATLTVVGPRPPKDIVEFGKRNSECVQVTGYVPDLKSYFERAALMVVPVRAGSGMRVRILEALARGIPVVTTTTGVEGIDAINGEHLLVADTPTDFAEAVVRLLKNPRLGELLAQNGRRLIEEKYDWQVVLPKLEAIYELLKVL